MEVVVEDREAADGQGLCLSFSGFPGPWLRVMPVLFRLFLRFIVRQASRVMPVLFRFIILFRFSVKGYACPFPVLFRLLRVMPVLFRLVVFPVVRFPVVGPLAFAGGAESPPLHC